MATEPETLPVVFRRYKGEVCAYFPTLEWAPGQITCYAHVGQHGGASREWLRRGRPAGIEDYILLLKELANLYAPEYTLRVYKRAPRR